MFRREFLSKIGQACLLPFAFYFAKDNENNVKQTIRDMEKASLIEYGGNGKYSRKYTLEEKTQYYQLLLQLHDKQVISTKTLCEEIGLDYDTECYRARIELGSQKWT